MTESGSKRCDAGDPSLQALLREGPWIRRLALGLVRDAASAEDLSQEVWTAILQRNPSLSGPRLRAWVRTVARRLAGRRRDRERLRAEAESRVARAEAVGASANERLTLHRRLAAAIESLREPYRTALILRYMEDLPPREIAERLDITREAARKRVSRGLSCLRDELAHEFGGDEASWVLAFGPLLMPHPREGSAPAVTRGGHGLEGVFGRWGAVCSVACVLLGALLFVWRTQWGSVRERVQEEVAIASAPGLQGAATPVGVPRREGSESGSQRAALWIRESPDVGGWVRVEDVRGRPLPSARVAWIGRDLGVHALVLGGDGRAPLPEEASGGRLIAGAPGHGEAFARVGLDRGSDVVLRLEDANDLRGRLVEDGEAPESPLWIDVYPGGRRSEFLAGEWELERDLEKLGVLRDFRPILVRADGSFLLEGIGADWSGTLRLPLTHILTGVDGVPRRDENGLVPIAGGRTSILLETTKYPTVRGRMLWNDDGSPVHGGVLARRTRRNGSGDSQGFSRLLPDGRFEVALPPARGSDGALDPKAIGTEVFEDRALALTLDGADDSFVPFEKTVDLDGLSAPIDLGDIRVSRAKSIRLRMLDRMGHPIDGTMVLSSIDEGFSDEEGLVTLRASGEEHFEALAAGFSYARRSMQVGGNEASHPVDWTLEAGVALAIAPAPEPSPASPPFRAIEISWRVTPFQGAGQDLAGTPTPLPGRAHRAFQEGKLNGQSWNWSLPGTPGSLGLRIRRGETLLLPGLLPGGVMQLREVDVLGQELFSEEIVVPDAHGIQTFAEEDLSGGRTPVGRLRARVFDSSGAAIPGAHVFVHRADERRGKGMTLGEGEVLGLGPLLVTHYRLSVTAPGFVPKEVPDVMLTDDPVDVVLDPARTVTVRVLDTEGHPLIAEHMELRSGQWHVSRKPTRSDPEEFTVPLFALVLSVRLGTKTWEEPVPPGRDRVDLVLPEHGSLSLTVGGIPSTDSEQGQSIEMVLRPEHGEGVHREALWIDPEEPPSPLSFQATLLPGHYRVELRLLPENDFSAPVPLDSFEVEIKAGKRTEVRRDLP